MRFTQLPQTVTVKGRILNLVVGVDHKLAIQQAKAAKKMYRLVSVYNKNLQGKRDLHGRPYGDTVWLFVEA